VIERRPKGSRPKWADGKPLYEHLNVPLTEISTCDPTRLELVQGISTLVSLGEHHGRSVCHYWRGDYYGAACKPVDKSRFWAKPMAARQRTTIRGEVTCILCLAWIRQDVAMCCRCGVEFICGCRCKCHSR